MVKTNACLSLYASGYVSFKKIYMGQSTQITETKMKYILQYQHSFIGTDVDLLCEFILVCGIFRC
jgi:hypothetical protein